MAGDLFKQDTDRVGTLHSEAIGTVFCACSTSTRVVIVGVGAVTPLGSSAHALWEGVKAGEVAIRPVQSLPTTSYRTSIAGEIQEMIHPVHEYCHPADHREPTIDFALKAAEEAIAQSRINYQQVRPERWGMVLGTCMAGFPSIRRWYLNVEGDGRQGQAQPLQYGGAPMGISPEDMLRLSRLFLPQDLAETVGGALGLKGPLLSVATACAAGANAIGYALEMIKNGQADVMLAGGTDCLSEVLFAGFHCLESLSPEPAAPYSYDRNGLSLGEGSGMLVLVREDLARACGAPILAEVLGYGLSADGYHPTAPEPGGRGAYRAMRAAMNTAGVAPEDVSYVNGHGTGTAKNDSAETRAIRLALGEAADHVGVSSTKSMIGHLFGAAGAVEAIVTVKALQEQIMPPTANYTRPDPECDLDYVPLVARPRRMDVALSNNFAFGGNNACVAFGHAPADQNEERQAPPPLRSKERVIATGMALLSPAGCSIESVWRNLVAGHVVGEALDGCWIGRVRDFNPATFLSARERRRMDQLSMFSIAAARLALSDAELVIDEQNKCRIGVMLGTGFGPLESIENFFQPLSVEGTAAANPALFPSCVFNAAAGLVAMHTNMVGPTSTVTAGHAAGAASLCYGYDLIASGQADVMVCLGVDTLTDKIVRAYRDGKMIARAEQAPFQGAGFVLTEGAGAVVLESLAHAQARGAHMYGEVLGYGIASDTAARASGGVSTSGMKRAMERAVGTGQGQARSLRCQPVIWANAAGYRPADVAEERAIRQVFGSASSTRVISPKKYLGEPGGAGAIFNAALALTAWQNGGVSVIRTRPGLVGTGLTPVQSLQFPETALVNSCSLGGTHFAILLASIDNEKVQRG